MVRPPKRTKIGDDPPTINHQQPSTPTRTPSSSQRSNVNTSDDSDGLVFIRRPGDNRNANARRRRGPLQPSIPASMMMMSGALGEGDVKGVLKKSPATRRRRAELSRIAREGDHAVAMRGLLERRRKKEPMEIEEKRDEGDVTQLVAGEKSVLGGLGIAGFKRRARQGSILRMVRAEMMDDREGKNHDEDQEEEEDEVVAFGKAESTSPAQEGSDSVVTRTSKKRKLTPPVIITTPPQQQQQQQQQQEQEQELRLNSSPPPRSFNPTATRTANSHLPPPRRSEKNILPSSDQLDLPEPRPETDHLIDENEDQLIRSHLPLQITRPQEQQQEVVTADVWSDTMAPPCSSSSIDNPEPQKENPVVKQTPGPNIEVNAKSTITTTTSAILQDLLPPRRRRLRRQAQRGKIPGRNRRRDSEIDILSNTESDDIVEEVEDNHDNEEEEEQPEKNKKRRSKAPTKPSIKTTATGTKKKINSSKPQRVNKSSSTKLKPKSKPQFNLKSKPKAKSSMIDSSDKENHISSSSPPSPADRRNKNQYKGRTTTTTTTINSTTNGLTMTKMRMRENEKELKEAKKKFQMVDQWELEFEDGSWPLDS